MRTVFILLFFLFCGVPYSLEASPLLYKRVLVGSDASTLERLGRAALLDEHVVRTADGKLRLELSEFDLAYLTRMGVPYSVEIEDLEGWYAQRLASLSPLRVSAFTTCGGSVPFLDPVHSVLGSMGGFLTYEEALAQIDSMASAYPNLISAKQPVSDTLLTTGGRTLYWVRISDQPNQQEAEPEALYTGIHHAREPVALTQLIYFMWYVLENYSTKPEIQHLVNETQMVFLPILNPDGYVFNQTNQPGGGGMWRKNRRNNGDGSFGVDNNRNYGYFWGVDDVGSSPQSNSDTYRGYTAFSEVENRAARALCMQHAFRVALNAHSYGNDVVYPWGYAASLFTPDSAAFVNLADHMTSDSPYTYGTGDQTVGYVTNGDSDDWMYGDSIDKPRILSMTSESGTSDDGFWPTQDRIYPICRDMLPINLRMAQSLLPLLRIEDWSGSYAGSGINSLNLRLCQTGSTPINSCSLSLDVLDLAGASGSALLLSPLPLPQQWQNQSLTYTLPSGVASGTSFRLVLRQVVNGVEQTDTLQRIAGNPAERLFDSCNSISAWVGDWGMSAAGGLNGTPAFTDSPTGTYAVNQTDILRLNNGVSLAGASHAELRFYARWQLESGYDFVSLEVSNDSGFIWTPVCTQGMELGDAQTFPQQPIFSGLRFNWIMAKADLSAWLGSRIWLRFRLKSDAFVNYDGMYVDDVSITVLQIGATGIEQTLDQQLRLWPNPSTDGFELSGLPPSSMQCIRVVDLEGRVVLEEQQASVLNRASARLADLEPSAYFVEVKTPQGLLRRKWLKQ
jgi:hypothetical protein